MRGLVVRGRMLGSKLDRTKHTDVELGPVGGDRERVEGHVGRGALERELDVEVADAVGCGRGEEGGGEVGEEGGGDGEGFHCCFDFCFEIFVKGDGFCSCFYVCMRRMDGC